MSDFIFTVPNSRTFALAHIFLLCHKTGKLPQMRQCHAGTLIYATVIRLAIAVQMNKFRNLGSFAFWQAYCTIPRSERGSDAERTQTSLQRLLRNMGERNRKTEFKAKNADAHERS
jgi:hypothetical protein